jgi:hypothetical protein
MRSDGYDPTRPEEEPRAPEVAPLDAAESTWDPMLWALYLRELVREHPPTLH